jgi:hypothetical protein
MESKSTHQSLTRKAINNKMKLYEFINFEPRIKPQRIMTAARPKRLLPKKWQNMNIMPDNRASQPRFPQNVECSFIIASQEDPRNADKTYPPSGKLLSTNFVFIDVTEKYMKGLPHDTCPSLHSAGP